ncbi:MAG TPA: energy-coupling factor transporter transmembrane protein EcfT [Clostridiaceae bacterium]|nr:energy-coupling factor transporter transmembrane protein EcfT [Clostridiaceae bacterium]
MIKDITLGQYIPGDSFLHRTDPRVKIILVLLYMVIIFLTTTYLGLLMVVLFTLIGIIGSGIPLRYALRGMKPIIVILLFATIINIFTVDGTPIFEYGFITITYEGLDTAAKMSIRLVLLVVSASLLTLTTTPIMLTDGIEKLLGPFKRIGVPAHEIAMMMTIALRFIPTLLEEADKIMKAQSARGADFDTGNLVERAKSFIPVLVPLFVSAFRRADELATAMEARCYRGSTGRTRMKQLKITQIDVLMIIIMLLFSVLVMYIQYA